ACRRRAQCDEGCRDRAEGHRRRRDCRRDAGHDRALPRHHASLGRRHRGRRLLLHDPCPPCRRGARIGPLQNRSDHTWRERPFRLLMCCLVTDGGGALILTTADRAKDFPTKPVYLLGTGESVETPMVSQMEDFTSSRAFRVAGAKAFEEAGITHKDVDHLMIYDAFAHLPIYGLEDLGFCKKGEAAAFI